MASNIDGNAATACPDWAHAFLFHPQAESDVSCLPFGEITEILSISGYQVVTHSCEKHRPIIVSLKCCDYELIPYKYANFCFGYDDPRGYLPCEIITLLDEHCQALLP